jgi:hypothetical protein
LLRQVSGRGTLGLHPRRAPVSTLPVSSIPTLKVGEPEGGRQHGPPTAAVEVVCGVPVYAAIVVEKVRLDPRDGRAPIRRVGM